ncbi:MAG: ATP-dependent RNA helicase RhlE [Cryomorphaceae bacterium]|jgi:ATP-dependent RNA helicase RhlE
MKFTDLGLSQPILDAIELQGYSEPSPIQQKAIPEVLLGKDVMAAAQTGTGKTAGFTLPILHRLSNTSKPQSAGNQARCLIITPTRELAAQIHASVETYGQNLKIKSAVVFGGVKINPQMQRLRGGVDVLIATPGRLLDLHNQNAIAFDKLEVLVLDEADRMLDMGFIHDIRRILKLLPKKRQTLLFSATFSEEIRSLARTIVHQPVEVSVSPANSTVDTVKQRMIAVEKADKASVLTRLIKENDWFKVLVFSRTKHGANKLAVKLEKQGIEASAIHGNKSQAARTRALADFKADKVRVLVATDIAARGIDIDQLPHVVNFDLPQVAEDYVHRIGRTGRAGATGEAVSLVAHDEYKQLQDIERLIKKTIPREELDGYEPKNSLPASKGDFSDRKPSKPKKSRPSNNRSGQRSSSGGRNEDAGRGGNQEQRKPQSADGAKKKPSYNKRRRPANKGSKPSSGAVG